MGKQPFIYEIFPSYDASSQTLETPWAFGTTIVLLTGHSWLLTGESWSRTSSGL